MKHIIIYCAILLCITLSACEPVENTLSKHFEFEASDFTVLEEKDTHGGFHGDGSYYAKRTVEMFAKTCYNTLSTSKIALLQNHRLTPPANDGATDRICRLR